MSRHKDRDRRCAILAEAKLLFAKSGYDAISMSMLATNVGIPVGSLYTYFESKEKLLACIVEEGWGEFVAGMEAGMASTLAAEGNAATPRRKNLLRLAYLIKAAMPVLFEDVDLISILLLRAGKSSGLEGKFNYLSLMVTEIVESLGDEAEESKKSDNSAMRTGLAVMLLGSFEAMRLSRHAGIGVGADQVIAFLVATVETALGCRLPDLEQAQAKTGFSAQASV
jgi:AcrR family transcriptional regulator